MITIATSQISPIAMIRWDAVAIVPDRSSAQSEFRWTCMYNYTSL
jgi:hypothetical protein